MSSSWLPALLLLLVHMEAILPVPRLIGSFEGFYCKVATGCCCRIPDALCLHLATHKVILRIPSRNPAITNWNCTHQGTLRDAFVAIVPLPALAGAFLALLACPSHPACILFIP